MRARPLGRASVLACVTAALLAGCNCAQTTSVYGSPIGSDRWSALAPALRGSGQLPGLVVQGADWYLPLPGDIYHGERGSHPSTLGNPCPHYGQSAEVPALAVADSQHLDAMCVGGGAAGSAQYQLYGTTDGARHWRKAGGTHLEPSGLYGIADNGKGVLLLAVASGRSEILRSTDDGASLTNASIKTATGGIVWTDLGFTTASQAIAVLGGTALYLSRDAGSSWSPVRF